MPAHARDSRESGQYLGEKLLDAILTSLTPRALLAHVLTQRRFDDTIAPRRAVRGSGARVCTSARVYPRIRVTCEGARGARPALVS